MKWQHPECSYRAPEMANVWTVVELSTGRRGILLLYCKKPNLQMVPEVWTIIFKIFFANGCHIILLHAAGNNFTRGLLLEMTTPTYEPAVCLCGQEGQGYSCGALKRMWPECWRRLSSLSTLPWWGHLWNTVSRSGLPSSRKGTTESSWGLQRWIGPETSHLWGKSERSGSVQPVEQKTERINK